ncbi:MAG: dicarboxylate/amino acid:cation symporter, partial [Lachnospiraceae bacterium]|nr:dicarboxylate/amino acid:cation symporter [Lachnospiraceae bacterium]
IVPDNFFGAFVNSSTLQLIFLGILIGGVVPHMGEKAEKVASFLSAANDLFLKVATTITKILPIAVFAFIGSMVLTMDVQVIRTLLSLFICILVGLLLMTAFYFTVVLVMTRSNPVDFARKVMPAWLNAFALSSSSASMPFTMNTCEKKLGISPKLFSFSIPLGATINMDGFVIVLTIAFLFLAKVFGVELHGGDIGTLMLTIILLSFGAPGMPGVGTVCMSVLLLQFHIPMEALTVFIGIDALTDPLGTANNVLGDIVGTYCIGKTSGLMADEK